MAAWIVVGVMAGVAMGMVMTMFLMQRGETSEEPRATQPVMSAEMMETLFTRLLDATIPITKAMEDHEEWVAPHDPEYDAPDDEVLDWTDPFIGVERPLVGRLAPGEGIPGMPPPGEEPVGGSMFDEWLQEDEAMVAASWVEPVQLDDETRVE